MVHPNFEKWNQKTEDVRLLFIEAKHTGSRERFQALYMIHYQPGGGRQPKLKEDEKKGDGF